MIIARPREPDDTRTSLTPESVRKLLQKPDTEVVIEKGLTNLYSDDVYVDAGAKVASDRKALFGKADVLLRIHPSSPGEASWLKKDALHVSFLDPFNNGDLVRSYADAGIAAVSMEMIPRTTLAQKMDALSSQASLAGYVAVIKAAEESAKILPMMMTPAGTIKPARVFIIGAGVAGLQAIATAKRMGARVEAFDTRPVVEEQVQSLGAKFVKIDLGETGQTKDGYAKALTPEQLEIQRQGMAKICAQSDIVITTAKLFGRKAPVIINADMVAGMKPGSVIVDLAAGTGGNVEGTVVDKTVDVRGVKIIGLDNLPGEAALDASLMYGSNLVNLIHHFWDDEKKGPALDREAEILAGCQITRGGAVVNETIPKHLEEN